MRRSIPMMVAVLIAGCTTTGSEGDDPASSTTSTSSPSTSTSTQPPITTTSTIPTTTIPPTTTAPGPAGNWAELPVVGSGIWNGMALGWWDGGVWVQAEEGSVLPAVGGEDYQVALIGSEEIIQGGAPDDVGCEVLSYFLQSIAFENGDALDTVIDDGSGGERSISGVAVSAAWDITPRPFVFAEPRPEMETAALELLTARGFDRTSAPIVQVVEGDLESDGSIESIVVAEDTELANSISDVYSLAFILSESDPTPVVVAESAFPPGTEGYPATLRVSAVADLNGDDSLEVVVDLDEWESDGIAVFERTVGGYEARIGAGCGA